MWNPQTMELMPGFWPPRPGALWNILLQPLRRYYLHSFYGISSIAVSGLEKLSNIREGDGVLLAPNHSHDSDPHVMMDVGRQLRRQLYFMAAWQVFLAHHGIDGWVMQRFGAFSVDREGCDRRAIRQATELLTGGKWLVVFPEGEIYHTNERLTPLREGVGFMAITAQRDLQKGDLEKSASGKAIWVVPTSIRYVYDDITPLLNETVAAMERRLMLKSKPEAPLPQRITAVGEVLLTIKEKEQLGRSNEQQGDLPARLAHLINHILSRHETAQLQKTHETESIPVRVKTLRRNLLEKMCDDKLDDPSRRGAHDALDDLHLVLQLYSYPGDYVTSKPTVERMAETIEKFEEDLDGVAKLKGKRRATVTLGVPIDVRPFLTGRPRAASVELTTQLEHSLRSLMNRND